MVLRQFRIDDLKDDEYGFRFAVKTIESTDSGESWQYVGHGKKFMSRVDAEAHLLKLQKTEQKRRLKGR